jgi:hypothetical protein
LQDARQQQMMNKPTFRLNFLLATIVLMVGLVACSSGSQYPDDIKALDQAIDSLTIAHEQLQGVDTAAFLAVGRDISKNMVFIQSYYQDTMPRETAFILSDYGSLSKTFRRFRGNRGKIVHKISFTLIQMQELRVDLENNAVSIPDPNATTDAAESERSMTEQKRVKLYVGTEVTEASRLIKQVQAFVVSRDRAIKLYDKLNPKVMAVVEEVDSKM